MHTKKPDPALYRVCGACNACCRVMAVPELNKPEWKSCPMLSHDLLLRGCSLYAARPPICRVFYCLWQCGRMKDVEIPTDEDHRPDRFGLIGTWDDQADVPVVIETLPGTRLEDPARAWILSIARRRSIHVRTVDRFERLHLGPQALDLEAKS